MFADDVIKLIEYFKNEYYEDYFFLGKRIDDLTREIEDINESIRELKIEVNRSLNQDDSEYDFSKDDLPL